MKWYSIKDKRPPKKNGLNWPFLALVDIGNERIPYLVTEDVHYGEPRYVEAYGEQYMWWSEDEIIAWTTIGEVIKDYLKNSIMEENYIG